jgi:hypothetical protein
MTLCNGFCVFEYLDTVGKIDRRHGLCALARALAALLRVGIFSCRLEDSGTGFPLDSRECVVFSVWSRYNIYVLPLD